MIPRYARPEMTAVWSAETKFRIWFEIEAYAADALAKLGVIPKEAAAKIWEKGNAAKVFRNAASKVRVKLASKFKNHRTSTTVTANEAFSLRQAAFYQAIASWDGRNLSTDFDVVLFRASEHLWGEHIEPEADYGWGRYVTGGLHVERATGDHLGIIKPPNVAGLTCVARQYLNPRAQERLEANINK